MKRSKYTEEQIAFALRQAETGTRVAEIYRKRIISLDQLGGQMANVQDKRKRLGDEMQSILADLAKDPTHDLDKADVDHHAQLVRERLKGVSGDFENKRCISCPIGE